MLTRASSLPRSARRVVAIRQSTTKRESEVDGRVQPGFSAESVDPILWCAWLGCPARFEQSRHGPSAEAQQSKESPAAKSTEVRRHDMDSDQKVNQVHEDIELLELQLATKRAQLGLAEVRLEKSKRWLARYQKLLNIGRVTNERLIGARDDVLLHETHVASDKAAVQEAELRLNHAKCRLAYGEFPLIANESRLGEIEQRLASLERGLDLLQQEVASLKSHNPSLDSGARLKTDARRPTALARGPERVWSPDSGLQRSSSTFAPPEPC